MPAEHKFDQAEGLRQLLIRPSLRVLTVIGARKGLGATSVVVNLAAALARANKKVLVLDENLAHDNVANSLALRPRLDLLNALRDEIPVRDILLNATNGIKILPLARAMQALPTLNEAERERLLVSLSAASMGMDVVLVDATPEGHSVCASLSADESLLLVLNATAGGITESYTFLKQLSAQNGRMDFYLVVNKARNETEARLVYENMARVAQQHMKISLRYLGNIPFDQDLERATKMRRPLLEMSADSLSARAFIALAQQLMLLPAAKKHGSNAMSQLIHRLLQQEPVQSILHAVR